MKGNKLRITIVHAILFSVCLVACSQPKIVESLSEINCSDWMRKGSGTTYPPNQQNKLIGSA